MAASLQRLGVFWRSTRCAGASRFAGGGWNPGLCGSSWALAEILNYPLEARRGETVIGQQKSVYTLDCTTFSRRCALNEFGAASLLAVYRFRWTGASRLLAVMKNIRWRFARFE